MITLIQVTIVTLKMHHEEEDKNQRVFIYHPPNVALLRRGKYFDLIRHDDIL